MCGGSRGEVVLAAVFVRRFNNARMPREGRPDQALSDSWLCCRQWLFNAGCGCHRSRALSRTPGRRDMEEVALLRLWKAGGDGDGSVCKQEEWTLGQRDQIVKSEKLGY